MLFNSLDFFLFLIIVFSVFWLFSRHSISQKLILLVSSNIFYAFWDYRFLALLNLTIFIDFYCGKKIESAISIQAKRQYLIFSIASCLSILFVFKYFNFFAQSLSELLDINKESYSLPIINIILPVGISFYTFHGISYVVDIYNKKIKPEEKFINYALFVSYFPLLVAGPIERAQNLLSQINKKIIRFSYSQASEGMRIMLIGFFKKIVLADNCAIYANEIFNFHSGYNGSTLLLGGFFFAIQIYCDFSGYTDIAIGTSKLFGYELIKNFDYPYFSKNIVEFWKKWHISLSSFFRDYLYIPLGGNKTSNHFFYIRNIMIVFLLSGLWHGANYTFLLWGLFHGVLIIVTKLSLQNIKIANILNRIPTFISYSFTYTIVVLGWILFRSENLDQIKNIYAKIFSLELLKIPHFENGSSSYSLIILILCYFCIEFFSYKKRLNSPSELLLFIKNKPLRYLIYVSISIMILALGNFSESSFIYFQF